ncbi:MAG: alpha/beta fold hydrolase [Bacteroidia bacterium]
MQHELADKNQLYYEVSGKPDATYSLVFLNGLSQSTVAWTAINPAFQELQVISIDLIFQGKSTAEGAFKTYDQHAADVMHLLHAITTKKIILCGISYGSAVAQHLLVNYPNRFAGGILLSTFAHATPLFNAIGESWKAALLLGGYTHLLDIMLPTVLGRSYFENPFIPIETLKASRISANLSAENLLKLMQATEMRGDYRPQLKHISCPVLVVHGEEDFLISTEVAKEVAANIPHANFELIPKVGHTLNLEAIPQTIALIRKFIAEISA